MLKNKEGSTLGMLIVVIAILTVLALTVLSITLTDKLQYVQQDKKMQSYYLARAGADTVAEAIIANADIISDITDASGDPLPPERSTGFDNGYFEVEVTYTDALYEDVKIKSTGYTVDSDNLHTDGEQSSVVWLTLRNMPNRYAIYSRDNLSVDSMDTVIGDLGSGGLITDESKVRGADDQNYPKTEYSTPPVELPFTYAEADPDPLIFDLPSYSINSTFDLSDNFVESNTVDGYYVKDLHLSVPSSTATFDTFNSSAVIQIVADDLFISGDIVIKNGGILELYITNKAEIKNPTLLPAHRANQLIIYMMEGSTLELDTPNGFKGRIIAPDAHVSLASNSTLQGFIISNTYSGTSNSNVVFDDDDEEYLLGFTRVLWE